MKKFLKLTGLGCLAAIGFFLIFSIIGFFASNNFSETPSVDIEAKKVDSLEIKKRKKRIDSLNAIKAIQKEAAIKKLTSFKKDTDEFKGASYYSDKRTPYYTNVNFIYPYIGEKDNYYFLRLKFQYASNDWLFIQKATLLVDGEKFDIIGRWDRDNSAKIWEWLDIPVKEQELYILNKLSKSKSAKIRYVGRKYHNDRIITKKEKSIIKKTLDIYRGLK